MGRGQREGFATGEKPEDAEEIGEATEESSASGVMRASVSAGAVGDGDLEEADTPGARDGTQEAVEAIKKDEALEVVPVEDFEGAARVREAVAQEEIAEKIGRGAAESAPQGVGASGADAADKDARSGQRDEAGYVCGGVLTVAIHENNEIGRGGLEACPEGGTLAEIARVVQEGDARNGGNLREGRIGAAVVNGEDFSGGVKVVDFVKEGCRIACFVVEGNDNREGGEV